MKNPPCFFVQNNYVERITVPVANYARGAGLCLEDRSSFAEFDADDCGIDWSTYGHILPIGSVQFLRKLKKSKSLAAHIHHDDYSFSATTWKERLGALMLNEVGQVVLAGDVPELLAGGALHVRPNAVDKAFHAKVFSLGSWAEMRTDRGIADGLDCWASPAKEINGEWRCWFVGHTLVEISRYRKDGAMARMRGAPAEVVEFASTIAVTWLPAECVVMDIALTPDGPRVLEFNPIHGSGWYAADVPTVLEAWLAWSQRPAGRPA